jgi:hypothetical protein
MTSAGNPLTNWWRMARRGGNTRATQPVAARPTWRITMPTAPELRRLSTDRGGHPLGTPDGGTGRHVRPHPVEVAQSRPNCSATCASWMPRSGILAPPPACCRLSEGGSGYRLRPVFEAMGDPERILQMGAAGRGYTVKPCQPVFRFSHLRIPCRGVSLAIGVGPVWLYVKLRTTHREPGQQLRCAERRYDSRPRRLRRGFLRSHSPAMIRSRSTLPDYRLGNLRTSALVEQIRTAGPGPSRTRRRDDAVKLYEDLIGVDLRLEKVIL